MNLSQILNKINWSTISVKNRLLSVFSLCFIFSSISSIIINVSLKLPLEINIIVSIVLLIHSIAFYSSIKNIITDKGRFIYLSILVTLLPFAWVYNGGLTGSIPLYYFVYFTASILSLNYSYRNIFIAYILLITIVSLYIQIFHSEIIIPYESSKAQLFDLKLSFIQVILTIIMLTITYTNINDGIQLKLKKHKERLEKSYTNLASAKAIAEEATIAKSNFITNISHEVRTPLTGIIGISEVLANTPLDNDKKKLIQILKSSSTTLLELVNDLLDLSKIEANKLTLNNEEFTFRQSIREVDDIMSLQSTNQNLSLQIQVDENVPQQVILDRKKYKQVLMNLLSNAIKFTKKGMVSCSISFDIENNILTTKVKDTGIGIDSRYFDILFTPFTQIKTPGNINHNGVGMGLVISKKIVELMNGKIFFESQIDKGSCFTFSIPIISIEQNNIETKLEEITMNKKNLHILIAEDHKINQIVLSKLIEKLQHTYDLASNGQEAINLSKEKNYDAILMDIQMPIINGIDASREIMEHYAKTNYSPKIILCSANVLQLNDKSMESQYASDYLIKPINLEQLENVLTKI